MIVIAAVGLAINLSAMHLIKGSEEQKENNDKEDKKKEKKEKNLVMEGARLEILSDTVGSIGVIATALVIMFSDFYLADPIASIALAAFIIPRTWRLLTRSVRILMEGVPPAISFEQVRNAVLSLKGVTGVSDMHIWTITSGMDALSAHVVIINPSNSQEILRQIMSTIERDFGINYTTIQIETYHQMSGAP